jgi:hypothetical protein
MSPDGVDALTILAMRIERLTAIVEELISELGLIYR